MGRDYRPSRPARAREAAHATPDGLFAPRPVRSESELGRLLLRLDSLCACPLNDEHGRPLRCRCGHVERLADACPVNDAELAELMRAYDPEGYDGPPPPPAPGVALTHEARVNLYEERAALGYRLFRDDDLTSEDVDTVSIGSACCAGPKSGAKRQRGLSASGRVA